MRLAAAICCSYSKNKQIHEQSVSYNMEKQFRKCLPFKNQVLITYIKAIPINRWGYWDALTRYVGIYLPSFWGCLNKHSYRVPKPCLAAQGNTNSSLKEAANWNEGENCSSSCLAIKLIVVAKNGIWESWFTAMKWSIGSSKAKQNSSGLQRSHDSSTN